MSSPDNKSHTIINLPFVTDLVAQHLFGLETLQQTPAHEGAQDASAQGGLHLGNGCPGDAA